MTQLTRDSNAVKRLIQIIAILRQHPVQGISSDDILVQVHFEGTTVSQRTMLARDIDHLRRQGWPIDNLGADGSLNRYVLRSGTPVLQLALSEEEQNQLKRVAKKANISLQRLNSLTSPPASMPGSDPPDVLVRNRSQIRQSAPYTLEVLTHAHKHRCLVSFSYHQQARQVASDDVVRYKGNWYLVGREMPELETVKFFRLDRFDDTPELEVPGSAPDAVDVSGLEPDPMQFGTDPAITVELQADEQTLQLVKRELGDCHTAKRADGILLTCVITNYHAFFLRLAVLGTRVKLLGPAPIRQQFADFLHSFIEVDS